jgi:hypothetical protein
MKYADLEEIQEPVLRPVIFLNLNSLAALPLNS